MFRITTTDNKFDRSHYIASYSNHEKQMIAIVIHKASYDKNILPETTTFYLSVEQAKIFGLSLKACANQIKDNV